MGEEFGLSMDLLSDTVDLEEVFDFDDSESQKEELEQDNNDLDVENNTNHVEGGADSLEKVDGVEDDEEEDYDFSNDQKKSSPSLYSPLAKVLHEQGVLPSADPDSIKNIKDVDSFVELIKKEIEVQTKEQLEQVKKEVVTEDFKKRETVKAQLEKVTDNILAKDKNVASQLIYQDFINKGYTEEKAKKYTERSILSEDWVDDAKDAKQSILDRITEVEEEEAEERELEITRRKEEAKKETDLIKSKVFDTSEVLKGIPISKTAKDQIFNTITKPVSKNPNTGEAENEIMKYRRENPVDFVYNLAYTYTVTKGFKDWDYFKTKGRSSSILELENNLRKNNFSIDSGNEPSFVDNEQNSLDLSGWDLNIQ